MMDPAVKIGLASCVILAGVCAALLFRNDRAPTPPANSNAEEEILLRYRGNAAAPEPRPRKLARSMPATRNIPNETSLRRPATVVAPLDRREPPPALTPDYPESDRSTSSGWGVSMEMMLPASVPTDETPRTHKVVDGDTLAALAYRYLGSAARAQEIFDANRDVLQNPELLPIGVELKLPPHAHRSAAGAVP